MYSVLITRECVLSLFLFVCFSATIKLCSNCIYWEIHYTYLAVVGVNCIHPLLSCTGSTIFLNVVVIIADQENSFWIQGSCCISGM